MKINPLSGLIETISYLPSPHCDDRPSNTVIDTIVIHNISLPPGKFGGPYIEQFFCGQLDAAADPYFATIASVRVSAHLLIKRTGEIIQFVPFSKRAWHAGESYFQGKHRCNDFSIGIELEGTDDIPYEKVQYKQLSQLITLLVNTYPDITYDRIIGHADIAPGRKTDPGAFFDWTYLRGIVV